MDALVQRFGRVIVQHGHRLLADNRPGIHARIDEMHGAARDSHPMSQRLLPGRQAGKDGKSEGWMFTMRPANA